MVEVGVLRRMELLCGLIAGLAGILLPPYLILFGGESVGMIIGELATLTLFLFLGLAVATTAYLDSYYHNLFTAQVCLPILWAATIVLLGLTFLTEANLHLYVLPEALFTLLAATFGTVAAIQAQPAP